MTSSEFDQFLENLVCDYETDKETWDNASIFEFLDREGVDENDLKKVNPMDMIRAMSGMELYGDFVRSNRDFSPRCRILFGLAEELTYIDAKNHLSVGDLVTDGTSIILIVEDDYDAGWLGRDLKTNRRTWVCYHDYPEYTKIGTVTEDFIKNIKKEGV